MTVVDQFLRSIGRSSQSISFVQARLSRRVALDSKASASDARSPRGAKLPRKPREQGSCSRRRATLRSVDAIQTDVRDSGCARDALLPGDVRECRGLRSREFDVESTGHFPGQKHHERPVRASAGTRPNTSRASCVRARRNRTQGTRFELQIATVVMHAWSEVEQISDTNPMRGRCRGRRPRFSTS